MSGDYLSGYLRREQRLCALDNAADIVRKTIEDNKNRLSAERSFLEQYCEGAAEVLFVWGQRESSPARQITGPDRYVAHSAKAHVFEGNGWRKSVEILERKARNLKQVCGGKQKSVLIDNIDLIKLPKIEVPSFISLKGLEVVEDGGPGKMYASALDGGFKRVRIISLFKNGEVDGRLVELLPGISDEMKCQKIKSGAQIMNSVPDDERELLWNGRLSFYGYGALPILHFSNENQFIMIGEKLISLDAEIVDVLFGPF